MAGKTHAEEDELEMLALLNSIEAFITQKIAPSVVGHGGKVEIVGFEDNKLTIGLSGACSTCSMDTLTKEGIAEFVMNEFPDLEDCVVIDIEDGASENPPLSDQIR